MKKKEVILFFLILAFITSIFFYKTIFQGLVPFPGDLLIAEYNPWKTYSYLGYNPGSFPNKAQYFDVLRQLYPWKTFSIDLLKTGEFPLWNPYNFSGAPLLENFQSAIFYPFNLLYLIFPQVYAWSLLVVLQPLLAGFFTFLFARKIGISKFGSLLSAVTYGFSSFMTVWLEYNTIGHVILWLPLILLCIENLLSKIEVKWILIFLFSAVSSLLAGHPQIFVYGYLFVLVYGIYRNLSLRHHGKILLFWFGLFVLPLLLGAIQIIPGIELIRESARAPHDYNFLIHKILIQPWQFIMMVIPDFFGNPATRNYWLEDTYIGKVTYIGIIPLIFVLFSFKHLNRSMILFFAVAGIIVLLLASVNPATIFLYKFNLPFISSSAPTLSIFLFCFCASVLSGFGIDIYRREKWNIARVIKLIAPLIFIILFLWIVVLFVPGLFSDKLPEHLTVAKRNLLYASFLVGAGTFLILVGTLKRNVMFLVLVLLFIVQAGDLFRYFTKFNSFVPEELVFPKAQVFEFLKKESGNYRFWGYGSANIEANFATQYRLFSPDGYDPLYPKRYGEIIQASKNGKIATEFTRQTRSDAFIAPGFGETDLSSNIYRLKILDLLGVKYVLDRVENGSTDRTFPKDRFKLIYEKDGWKIFENLKALPRAFLVSDYKVFRSSEEFEKIFFDKNFDPSKTVLLEENLELDHLEGGRRTPARWSIESYDPNKVIISTSSDSDAFLFLSDTYYPGWEAFVYPEGSRRTDGEETKIYRANYAFRAVVVPEGEHTVVMTYEPNSFRWGMWISVVSVAIVIILLLHIRVKRESEL